MKRTRRQVAMDVGELFYSSGKQCKNGHDDLKYTSNGKCVGCQTERNARYLKKTHGRESKSKNHFHSAKAARASRVDLYNLLVFVRGKILNGLSDGSEIYKVVSIIDQTIGKVE